MRETYPRVVGLLKREFEEKKVTKYAFCKKTGINPTSVDRYLCGISEPTYASLQKLSEYFKVSIPWLRGEDGSDEAKKEFDDGSYRAAIQWIVYNKDELIMRGPCALVAYLFDRPNEEVLADLRRAVRHKAAKNDKEPRKEL